jgi:hypothetical protein
MMNFEYLLSSKYLFIIWLLIIYIHKDLFIKNRTRTVVTLLQFLFEFLRISLYLYRGLNCPNRHPQPPEDPVAENAGKVLALEFINFEDGFVFVFLSVIIIATFFASVFICGALFTNKGVRRPLNQVSRFSWLFLFNFF